MMFGSIFYNCWAALFAFSIYFIITLQKPYLPMRIIIGSFATAIIVFVLMFVVRYLIAYILHTPESTEIKDIDEQTNEQGQLLTEGEQEQQQLNASTVEFEDESSEEIAQVVKTMLDRD